MAALLALGGVGLVIFYAQKVVQEMAFRQAEARASSTQAIPSSGTATSALATRPALPLVHDLSSPAGWQNAVGVVTSGFLAATGEDAPDSIEVAKGVAFAVTAEGHWLTSRAAVQEAWDFQEAPGLWRQLRQTKNARVTPWVKVTVGGKAYPATVVRAGVRHGWALLKIDRKGGPFFKLRAAPEPAAVTALDEKAGTAWTPGDKAPLPDTWLFRGPAVGDGAPLAGPDGAVSALCVGAMPDQKETWRGLPLAAARPDLAPLLPGAVWE
jgi:hypothetical protein